MRSFLALIMILFVSNAFAGEKNKSLEEKKADLISRLDQRIAELQKSKDCIQEAKDEKSLSKCRKGESRREKLRKKLKDSKKLQKK